MINLRDRRSVLVLSGLTGAALVGGCRGAKAGGTPEPDVGAVEDLMREHGVIRRALVVYREAAARLRTKTPVVAPDALQKTAKLFRSFAEDYHEKKLEEMHIFPALKRAGGA